ncbi:MAG: dipeptidase [Rhodospirillales bacterium]|nr:dipeptidase [Rhodospirillales bacterium]
MDSKAYQDLVMIDALQFSNWDRALFEELRAGGLTAVHVTITYWEDARATLSNIGRWNRHFRDHADLVMPARRGADILEAKRLGKTAIVLGAQNCSPIDDELALVQVMNDLGLKIMQLTYNNQSLIGAGCYEQEDPGISRFGRQVIREMNRVGMVVDLSHSAERTSLEAIEISERPVAITHANPASFHPALRNKSDTLLGALVESGGMLGFSLYPHHLANGADCSLEAFCEMAARAADLMGVDHIGLGSDLCRGWGYETLEWMRSGRWTFAPDFGEGSAERPAWPEQPAWFRGAADTPNIARGLAARGFSDEDVAKVMGANWLRFFTEGFEPRE